MIELIIVISIIIILAFIVLPNYLSYRDSVKATACNISCKELQKSYDIYLISEDINHTDSLFNNYLNDYNQQICPKDGIISYDNGKVRCTIHDVKEENDGDDVPYI